MDEKTPIIPTFVADNNLTRLENEIGEAINELGKKYYEANKEKPTGDFEEDITSINEKSCQMKLWKQYRLKLEDKILCDSCGAVLTGDSLFCNKCGSKVEEVDFSPILTEEVIAQAAPAAPVEPAAPVMIQPRVCPNCGKEAMDVAIFCEGCGTRL